MKLRITILGLNYAPEPTGNAPYTTALAERLADEGHTVTVVTGYPHYPEWRLKEGYYGWKTSECINGVSVTRLRHFIPSKVNDLSRIHMELSFGIRLLFARWHSPDVVVVVSPALFSCSLALLRARYGRNRPPAGIWLQDIYSRGIEETRGGGSAVRQAMKFIETVTLRMASSVTVVHDKFKDYIVSSLGVPEVKVCVIRNWTHTEKNGATRDTSFRERYQWNEDETVILHAGNMGMKQALENVVEAARLADSQKSKVKFVLLGDGNQRRHIQQLAEGVTSIQFIEPLSDADFATALHSADVLLVNELPGMREMSVPSKLTSYFSAGRPVLAATERDSTTANEISLSGGGICVAPGKPVELLSAAEELGQNCDLRTKLGQSGQAYSEHALSQDAAIVRYSDWLHSLVANRRRERINVASNNEINQITGGTR